MDYFEYQARKLARTEPARASAVVQPTEAEVTAVRRAIMANQTGIHVEELPAVEAPDMVRDMWHNAR